jgi:glutamyl-tRNA reductase
VIALSVTHRTAPAEIREIVHWDTETALKIAGSLREKFFSECFILSTCNRTEIYGVLNGSLPRPAEIVDFLKNELNSSLIELKHFDLYFSCGAANHLFRVACGLDSMILGDNQIFGQVKSAFTPFKDAGLTGTVLNKVFEFMVRAGKRGQSETEINEGAVTVSFAAVQLAGKIFDRLNKKKALIIGAGETASIAAKNISEKGIGQLTIVNRTRTTAEKLAKELNATTEDFTSLPGILHRYDIIISATAAKNILISLQDVEAASQKRKTDPFCFIDIGMPRNISFEIKKIENVYYYDIDSLNGIVDYNLARRKAEALKVETIIEEELTALFAWFNSRMVVPTIKAMRELFEQYRAEEVERHRNRFSEDDFEKLNIITKRIVSRILQQPTLQLKQYSEPGSETDNVLERMRLIKELFLGPRKHKD